MTYVRALAVLAALILTAVVVGSFMRSCATDEISSARADARSARQIADARSAESVVAQAAADSAVARADRAEHRASVSEARASQLKESYLKLASVAPDTCKPVIAAADSVIAQKDSAISALDEANSNLRFALDTTSSALSRQVDATRRLSAATAKLESASRPSLLSKLLPRFGVGASAGVDVHGKPNALTGITLGWSF